LNLLYRFVRKQIPYPLGAFENKRSFLSIDNLNFSIHQILINCEFPSGIYNVADDDALSTKELINVIVAASGSKGSVWILSKGLVAGIAKIRDALHLPVISERLKKLTESYVVSNDKIKHALGIEKLPVSSRVGLFHTIKS